MSVQPSGGVRTLSAAGTDQVEYDSGNCATPLLLYLNEVDAGRSN